MSYLRTTSLIALSSVTVLLAACQKSETAPTQASAPAASQNNELKTLSIGFQKSSLNSIVLKQQHLLEKEFPKTKIEWKEFPAGPQMLEALAVGAVDLGTVGNTPSIFAQAADKGIVYVGYENVHPKWQAVLVPNDSPIKSIADLKGKRIGFFRGTSLHLALYQIIKKYGLTEKDFRFVNVDGAVGYAALASGDLDAIFSNQSLFPVVEQPI